MIKFVTPIPTHHQCTPDTASDAHSGHNKTTTKYQNTDPPSPSAPSLYTLLFPANPPPASPLTHPLFQSLSRFTGIGFVHTKRD